MFQFLIPIMTALGKAALTAGKVGAAAGKVGATAAKAAAPVAKGLSLAGRAATPIAKGLKSATPLLKGGVQKAVSMGSDIGQLSKMASPVMKMAGGGDMPPLEGGVQKGGFLSGLLKDRLDQASKNLVDQATGFGPQRQQAPVQMGMAGGAQGIGSTGLGGLNAPGIRPMVPQSQDDLMRLLMARRLGR